MEEAWRLSLLRFIHGVMLHQICERSNIDNTEENRELIKASLKKRERVDSLANLTAIELRVFVSRVVDVCSRDLGIEISDIGEPPELNENSTLQDFFRLIYNN